MNNLADSKPASNPIIEGDSNVARMQIALSSVGAIVGIVYAVKNKKKFWPSVGYFFLGSLTGSLAGIAVGNVMKSAKK